MLAHYAECYHFSSFHFTAWTELFFEALSCLSSQTLRTVVCFCSATISSQRKSQRTPTCSISYTVSWCSWCPLYQWWRVGLLSYLSQPAPAAWRYVGTYYRCRTINVDLYVDVTNRTTGKLTLTVSSETVCFSCAWGTLNSEFVIF